MNEVGTVYLARAINGIEPFRKFLSSYSRFAAGMPNQLILVFKGFRPGHEAAEFEKVAAEFQPKTIHIADFGYDIRAYSQAVRHFDFNFFCCFNSFSEILDEGWLRKMFTHASRNGVGLVGATGSGESMYSNALAEWQAGEGAVSPKRLQLWIRLQLCRLCFDPFPNYHIRTNAFISTRPLLLQEWPRWVLTKRGAYLFENGKRSLTKRLQAKGLKALVVGRDGAAYEPAEWARSSTFRSGDQSNLLVADNQTRQFAEADLKTQAKLSAAAWSSHQVVAGSQR